MSFLYRALAILATLGLSSLPSPASEADALSISANIRALHMPFGTILDPVYASASSTQITGYTRCGDSALWTGAYLAAEAFRYKTEPSADALNNVKAALAGLKSLADVTGDNRLARCIAMANSPYSAGIESEEAHNTVHSNPPWIWLDNTSRDEVVGAFFGLGAAYDLVDDATVKSGVSDLATRLIGFVAGHQWSPNDDISNTFLVRPEELQMLLQVARHVNPANGVSGPLLVPPVGAGVLVDVRSDSSYFKFNLDYLTFYNLLRLQNNSDNNSAYQTVRAYTAPQQNAFFDAVDLALKGPNAARDLEMRTLLEQWLARPRRDAYVDVTSSVKVCGSEACQPIPVPIRPPADFLWQVSPFQLLGGGSGTIEGAGIDYILPYWMGRYYGAIAAGSVQSAAAPLGVVAPDSLASLFSSGLPDSITGGTLTVTDSLGTVRAATLLYASTGQLNFLVPDSTAAGVAQFSAAGGAVPVTLTGTVAGVAPALFSINGVGTGVAAATAVRVQAANPRLQSAVPVFQCAAGVCSATPISLAVDTPIYVSFFGTGIRNRNTLSDVTVGVNGINVPILYAGPAPGFLGLDQVNVSLVLGLRGAGLTNVVLTIAGVSSNTVTIDVQ